MGSSVIFSSIQSFGCLLAALAVAACGTTTKIDQLNSPYPANPEDCKIVFLERTTPPEEPYQILGKIETHLKRNLFFGGTVRLKNDALQELRPKACLLGGNAVVIDDYVESSAAEMTHVHVWATVLRVSK
jgi:hypothetical protein